MQGSPQNYSEQSFWDKIPTLATQVGKEAVEKILLLFYAAQRPETPLWAKTVIYGALAYLILPADVIPDIIPVTGYVDDLGTVTAALSTIALYINSEVKAAAKQKVTEWFGDSGEGQGSQVQRADSS